MTDSTQSSGRRHTVIVSRDYVVARKARIGWWVNGSWCPTVRVRDHWIKKLGGRVRGDGDDG